MKLGYKKQEMIQSCTEEARKNHLIPSLCLSVSSLCDSVQFPYARLNTQPDCRYISEKTGTKNLPATFS